MVASHMEMMKMILKGFMAAAVIYSKPLAPLFFFAYWNMTQSLQHYCVRDLFFVQHCSHNSAVPNTYLLRPKDNIYSVVFQILKDFF